MQIRVRDDRGGAGRKSQSVLISKLHLGICCVDACHRGWSLNSVMLLFIKPLPRSTVDDQIRLMPLTVIYLTLWFCWRLGGSCEVCSTLLPALKAWKKVKQWYYSVLASWGYLKTWKAFISLNSPLHLISKWMFSFSPGLPHSTSILFSSSRVSIINPSSEFSGYYTSLLQYMHPTWKNYTLLILCHCWFEDTSRYQIFWWLQGETLAMSGFRRHYISYMIPSPTDYLYGTLRWPWHYSKSKVRRGASGNARAIV